MSPQTSANLRPPLHSEFLRECRPRQDLLNTSPDESRIKTVPGGGTEKGKPHSPDAVRCCCRAITPAKSIETAARRTTIRVSPDRAPCVPWFFLDRIRQDTYKFNGSNEFHWITIGEPSYCRKGKHSGGMSLCFSVSD